MPQAYWSAPCEWERETVFVIGGGPSVLGQDLEALRGRRVIAINSSVFAVPWADFLYFADFRWYCEPHNRTAVESFAGRVVTTSRMVVNKRVLLMRRVNPPLAYDQDALACKLTSITAATNLAAHLTGRGGTVVWLGIDGKAAPDGRTWHHAPHKWRPLRDRYEKHRRDIELMPAAYRAIGITVLLASPGSTYADLWPVVTLRDVLGDPEQARAA